MLDWVLEVHQKFDLMSEVLYLTVYIIDMYLSLQPVLRRELQLVGISALLTACKYEEIWAREVNDFILISDSAYTREQILKMEKAILNRLEWNLTVPTPYVFLMRFAKAASFSDHKNDKGDGERCLLLHGAGAAAVRAGAVQALHDRRRCCLRRQAHPQEDPAVDRHSEAPHWLH